MLTAVIAAGALGLHFGRRWFPCKQQNNSGSTGSWTQNGANRSPGSRSVGAIEEAEAASKMHTALPPLSSLNSFRHVFFTAICVALFNIYPMLASYTFQAFSCTPVDFDRQDWRLSIDHSIQCYESSTHNKMMFASAVPMLVVYLIGLPLTAAFFLRKNHSPWNQFHYLTKGVRKNRYWWFLVVTLRKLAVIAIANFTQENNLVQLFLTVVVLLFSMAVHMIGSPYEHPIVNYCELASLLTSATLFSSCFVFLNSASDQPEISMMVAVVLASFYLIFMAIALGSGIKDLLFKCYSKHRNHKTSCPVSALKE